MTWFLPDDGPVAAADRGYAGVIREFLFTLCGRVSCLAALSLVSLFSLRTGYAARPSPRRTRNLNAGRVWRMSTIELAVVVGGPLTSHGDPSGERRPTHAILMTQPAYMYVADEKKLVAYFLR